MVPFSCKGRTFCSSCGGRQMAQTAAHLVDRVFADVDVCQWVLTVPQRLRLAMAMNAELSREVTRAHIRAVSASYERRGQVTLDRQQQQVQGDPEGDPAEAAAPVPSSPVRLDIGAANSTQRSESSLGISVHFESLDPIEPGLPLDAIGVWRNAASADPGGARGIAFCGADS
ncbi:hypothetical protein Poly30_33360 [Planctomycetes bacterium Poly30]|uniref:Transposase zinc-binding domain-containing protein n=2 Tax=Saltatorellus ferox TaxID=2528018 RepID=A0A518EUN0_9BACT|nr:hypothetical protein Poly30_33360 [Planctomycetes bacterium Poly30]